jgi:hypothetical protein
MKCSWKINGIYKADADIIGNEIQSIGSQFTTKDIVNKARDKNTQLHKLFEWNNKIAGEKYREIQAGDIIRNLVVVKVNTESGASEKTNIRVFVSDNRRNGGYKPITVVLRQQDEYERLLEQAYKELQAFKDKYENLSELSEIFDLIDVIAV